MQPNNKLLSLALVVGISILAISCGGYGQKEHQGLPEMTSEEENKFNKYFYQGEILYSTYCSNCHQPNRKGLGKLIPPVSSSDFMDNQFEKTICIIKNGISGPITVNGVQYDGVMPPVAKLSNLEIAEIATYIYNADSAKRGIIPVKSVETILSKCSN